MKVRRKNVILATAAIACIGSLQHRADAFTYYWDSTAGDGLGSVNGTWNGNTGTSNWSTSSGGIGAPPGNVVTTNSDLLNFNSGSGTCTIVGTVNAASFTFGSSAGSAINLSGGVIDNGGANFAFSMSTGSGSTISSTLQGAGGLTRSGSGSAVVLALTGTNLYSGPTTITSGNLRLGNGGATGSLSTSSSITNNATFSINRNNAVTQGTDFSGASITGTGAFTQMGGGTTTLNTSNGFSGAVTISGGTLSHAAANHLGSGTSAIALSNNAVLQSTGTFSTSRGISVGTGGGTVEVTGSNVLTRTGTVTGSTTLTKTGTGTLYLNNTVAGPVTVSAGTLGGNSTISGLVTIGASGTLSPGNSPGSQTYAAGLGLSGGGTFKWELGAYDATPANAGTNWDLGNVTGGNLALGGTSKLDVQFTGIGNPDNGNAFWNSNHSWKAIDITSPGTNTGNSNFASLLNATYTKGNFTTSVVTTGIDTGDVFVNYTLNASNSISLTSAAANTVVSDGTNANDNVDGNSAGSVHIAGSGTNYISEVDGLTGNVNKGSATVDNNLSGLTPVYVMIWTQGDALLTNTVTVTNGEQVATGTDQWSALQATYGLNGAAGNDFEYLFKFSSNAFTNGSSPFGAVNWDFGADSGVLVDRIAVVPEPGSALLFGAGVLGLLHSRRRNRSVDGSGSKVS